MAESFRALDAEGRVRALLDAPDLAPLTGIASRPGLLIAGGRVARTRPSSSRSTAACSAARSVWRRRARSPLPASAREGGLALVLVLESAGARLSEGMAALGVFRPLYRAAVAARAAGCPMVALAPGNCFGGAAMLASLCGHRLYTGHSLTAMSGPAVVAAVGGRAELDAADPAAVGALMGAQARAAIDTDALVLADDVAELRAQTARSLEALAAAPVVFERRHAQLRERLKANGLALPSAIGAASPRLAALLAALGEDGFESVLGGGVLRGVRTIDGRDTSIVGLVDGVGVGAQAAWMCAESIHTAARQCPERPILALYDAGGHAATARDERVVMTDYIAHLACAVRFAQDRGVPYTALVHGAASGGAYIAFVAAARRVLALPQADIRILPEAIASVIGSDAPSTSPRATWPGLDVVDELVADTATLRSRLAA